MVERLTENEIDFQQITLQLQHQLERISMGITAEKRLSLRIPDGQTASIVRELREVALSQVNLNSFTSHFPALQQDEAAIRAFRLLVGPLKEFCPDHPFGSAWNEWTVILAAKRLGMPINNLKNLVDSTSGIGVRLRMEQARVSSESEDLLLRALKKNLPVNLKLLMESESWLKLQIEEASEDLEKIDPDLSKSEKGKVISDSLKALIRIIDLAPGQDQPFKKLRRFLLEGRLGLKKLSIVDLNCVPHRVSQEGIEVITSADDFVRRDLSGKGIIISQREQLEGAMQISRILTDSKINHRIIIVVIDNDKFNFEGQENRISQFADSLRNLVVDMIGTGQEIAICRSSSIVNIEDFSSEWEEREKARRFNGKANTLTERLIMEEFDHLLKFDVPMQLKTKDAAMKRARHGFLLQFALGATLSEFFDPAIIAEQSRAHQQSSENFLLGSQKTGRTPVIFSFWLGRREID